MADDFNPKNYSDIKAYVDKTVNQAITKRVKTDKEKLQELETVPTTQKTLDQAEELRNLIYTNAKYRQIPVYGIRPADTVTQIRQLLDSVNTGIFYFTALFVDSIFEDERIWGVFNVRLNSLISSKIEIIAADESKKALKIKKACEKSLKKMITPAQISELLRWGLSLGVGFANITMHEDSDEYIPQIEIWHPRFARYDWSMREYKIVTENLGEVYVLPDDPAWMIVEPYGDNLPWTRGLVRPLATPYLMRYWMRQWWVRYQESNGKPIIGAIVPPTATEEDEARFVKELGQLAFNSVVRLPQGQDGNRYGVELLSASADLYKGFEAFLKYIDSSIAITIVGQDYSTSGAPGFGSVENPGRAIREEIRKRDAAVMEDIIREKLLKPWAQANFGNAELAPSIKFDVEIKEDQLQQAQWINTLFAALINAKDTLPVDCSTVLANFDIPQYDPAEWEQMQKDKEDKENKQAQAEMQAANTTDSKSQQMDAGVEIKEHEDAVPDVKGKASKAQTYSQLKKLIREAK